MTDDNIIHLADKRKQLDRAPKDYLAHNDLLIAERPASPIVIVCHCTSPLFELLSGGKINCSRCGCALPASWRFE